MFIIANNSIIAKIRGEAQVGEIKFSSQRCKEAINAAREWNLVNAQSGKISDAAKWHRAWAKMSDCRFAEELNPGEFYII